MTLAPKATPRTTITALAYILSIISGNWLVATYGIITVIPGTEITGPAGVYMIGLTLALRDLLQDRVGPARTIPFMLIGVIISAAFSPTLALASSAAFLIAELLDMAVYTPLRKRGHITVAVLASNTVGLILDTVIFLALAFGTLAYWEGQIIGKVAGTLLALLILRVVYRNRDNLIPHYVQRRQARDEGVLMPV